MFITRFLATVVTAQAIPSLFGRASTCLYSSYVQCPQAGLPPNFCCPPISVCISLAANTTVLCCPAGEDCSVVRPITCDITVQDSNLYPNNTLKTTELNGMLPTCGSLCCPFGFSCDSVEDCVENANQKVFNNPLLVTLFFSI
jgi:hypothetical protein